MMADALLADKTRDFWHEVKQCKSGKQNVPPVIDDVHGGEDIAKLWGSKLESYSLLLTLILHLI